MNSEQIKTPSKRSLAKYKLIIDEWFKLGLKDTAEAYKVYYPKSKDTTARVNFSQIKSIPEIKQYIAKKHEEIQERNKVTIDECVSALAKMMRFDIADLYDEKGALKTIHDIPEETRLAIAELSTYEEFDFSEEEKNLIGFTKKLKTIDRKGVIVELMKHLGGYEKDNAQKVDKIPSREERDAFIKELKEEMKKA